MAHYALIAFQRRKAAADGLRLWFHSSSETFKPLTKIDAGGVECVCLGEEGREAGRERVCDREREKESE